MKHQIALEGEVIAYTLRRHPRARRTCLTLYPDGSIAVTLTATAHERTAERFIQKQLAWIRRHRSFQRRSRHIFLPRLSKKRIEECRQNTRRYVHEKLEYYNTHYQHPYNRVAIKNHQKQWGSCSSKKNLNYNLRISLLPPALADLVIVHELCHVREMNHSSRFWELVGRAIPEYKKLEQELKRYVIT